MDNPPSIRKRIETYWEFSRPFTLIPPALGVFSGGTCAAAALMREASAARLETFLSYLPFIAGGAIMAALLNAGSNAVNQLADFEIDSVNKPGRPLPSGRITKKNALMFAVACFFSGLLIAFFITPYGRRDCLILATLGLVFTLAYSVKPIRAKRYLFLANVTISIPRGCLLIVAGWACAAPVWNNPEPWYLGGVVLLFLLGAASTKDFSDTEGDKRGGCTTLPIRFGAKRATLMISPFLVFPWLLYPIGAIWKRPGSSLPLLRGNPLFLSLLGIGLFLHGGYVAYLLLRNPEELSTTENHPSWKHMYLMMLETQLGTAVAYLLG